MIRFKIGDIVRCLMPYDGNKSIVGMPGKVVDLENYGPVLLVKIQFFERIDNGHDSGGSGEDGFCWNVTEDKIRLEYAVDGRQDFAEGDLVRLKGNHGPWKDGYHGIIRWVDGSTSVSVLVEFFSHSSIGHDGNSEHRCLIGHGWWVSPDELDLVERPRKEGE